MKKSGSESRKSEGKLLQPQQDDRNNRRSENYQNYFNEPRVNRIKSLQDNLQDIKNCVPQDINDINELSLRTKEILYKNVRRNFDIIVVVTYSTSL